MRAGGRHHRRIGSHEHGGRAERAKRDTGRGGHEPPETTTGAADEDGTDDDETEEEDDDDELELSGTEAELGLLTDELPGIGRQPVRLTVVRSGSPTVGSALLRMIGQPGLCRPLEVVGVVETKRWREVRLVVCSQALQPWRCLSAAARPEVDRFRRDVSSLSSVGGVGVARLASS